ncbi:hypothetical protein H4Q26_010124 [Puccinia striiformis f. sp. tritici PST-130]|nr:hypothetical protein H4Q26_010124 [Puccinia striiformis f. sp. tritici PST-130]
MPTEPPLARLAPSRSLQEHDTTTVSNDFDSEIARQVEVIRKERQSRRIEHLHESIDSTTHNNLTYEPPPQPIINTTQQQRRLSSSLAPVLITDSPTTARSNRDQNRKRVSGPNHDVHGGVLVGNLIGEGHVNYVLMYNMLTGIRIGVSRCQAKVRRPLTDEDYTARHKFTFDVVGNELTPSAKYDFKFKDYAPWVFRELREYFKLDPADYLLSLTAKYILSELGSPGKSGSFFYFSRDYKFIIKTIHSNEKNFLRLILKDYHTHVKNNPHTLLSRFYGLHRVKLPRGRKIHFVIMNNLFPPHRDIHETFDLKGSAIGREYPESKAKAGSVLKDLNWIHRGRRIELGPTKKSLFEEQLKRDTLLLQQLGIMDYSLLIGLHDMRRGNSEGLRDDQLRVFQPVAEPGGPSSSSAIPNPNTATSISSTGGHGAQNATQVPIGAGQSAVLNASASISRRATITRRLHHHHSSTTIPTTIPATNLSTDPQENAASVLRKAIQSSDPQLFSDISHHTIFVKDRFREKKKFIFYQDEGGFMASDDHDDGLPVIYYLGIIDILTPYSVVKKFEHFWKGMSHDKDMISAIPPTEYGQRFLNFLFSIIRNGNVNLRPKMEENPQPLDHNHEASGSGSGSHPVPHAMRAV